MKVIFVVAVSACARVTHSNIMTDSTIARILFFICTVVLGKAMVFSSVPAAAGCWLVFVETKGVKKFLLNSLAVTLEADGAARLIQSRRCAYPPYCLPLYMVIALKFQIFLNFGNDLPNGGKNGKPAAVFCGYNILGRKVHIFHLIILDMATQKILNN